MARHVLHKRKPPSQDLTVTTGLEDTGNATTNGTNLQAKIDAAVAGETIVVQSGATYFSSAGFTCPVKSGSSPITLTSHRLSVLPADGVRVIPATHASALAKLVGRASAVIAVAAGAHNWRFQCLEVTNEITGNPSDYSPVLVATATSGTGLGGSPTYAEVLATDDIVFDRMFIHNPEVTATNLHPTPTEAPEIYAGRGISLTGVNLTVKNCWIGSFAGLQAGTSTLTDSYGIYKFLGGPMLIHNNRIEAFFNNIFITGSMSIPAQTAVISSPTMGGATFSTVSGLAVGDLAALQVPTGTIGCTVDGSRPYCYECVQIDTISGTDVTWTPFGPGALTVTPTTGGRAQWNGLQAHDITCTKNYLWKNPLWQVTWTGGAKDYIEVKTCKTGLYEGNIFAGACSASVAFEVAQSSGGNDSNGGSPWDTCWDQTFRNNLLLGDASVLFITLAGAQPSGGINDVSNVPGQNIVITNNLWQHITKACGSNPNVDGWLRTDGGQDVTVSHNTVRNINTLDAAYSAAGNLPLIVNGRDKATHNVILKDNIVNYGPDGLNYNSDAGYAGVWPPSGIVEDGNVVITDGSLTNDPAGAGQVPNSFRVANDTAVGFVDVTGADAGGDYHGYALTGGSTYHHAGTDGTDPGVDFTALDAALAGASPP